MKHLILTMGMAVSSYVFATETETTPTQIQKCEIIEQVGETEVYNTKVDIIKSTTDENQVIVLESTYTLGKIKYNDFDVTGKTARVVELGNGSGSLASSTGSKFISISIDATYLTSINKGSLVNFTNVKTFAITAGNTPANIDEGALPEEWATTCALTVPEEAYDAYLAAWGDYFKSINGVDVDHTATPVDEKVASKSCRVVGNKIILGESADVDVYSVTGQKIYSGVTDVVEVSNKGIYIVKTRNNTSKVVVK